MTFKKLSFFALLTALGMFARAQEKKTITLNEAIELGTKNSKQLKISQAKIDEATAQLRQAMDRKLPDASVTGSYVRLNSANISLKSKNNNNGGSGNGNEQPNVSQAAYGLLNISWPLYSGGRIRYGIESSEFLRKATTLDAAYDKDEIIQLTIESFANLFKAKSTVRLYKENLAQSQERVRELSNMEKNGLLPRNDLLKAQLQSSNIELNLLDAENNAQLANVNMNLLLGLPVSTDIVLDTSGIVRRDDDRALDDYLKAALANRKDLQAADLRRKAAESAIKSVKAELLPSVKLTGGYIAADVPHLLTVTNALNIGVGVNYSLGSLWKTKAKVKEANARFAQISIAQDALDDQITMQVNKNYFTLISNRKKIEVYAQAVEQASENYRIVKNKFDNSLATTTDLLEADVALLQAVLSHTLARADAFVAYHRLLQSTGTLSTEFIK